MGNRLFIYGTLSNTEIQKEVLGRVLIGIPDTLKGYRKSKIEIDGEAYPLIVPDKNSKIAGLLIEVSDNELKKIDEYETDAYKRVSVVLESDISAWVYVER